MTSSWKACVVAAGFLMGCESGGSSTSTTGGETFDAGCPACGASSSSEVVTSSSRASSSSSQFSSSAGSSSSSAFVLTGSVDVQPASVDFYTTGAGALCARTIDIRNDTNAPLTGISATFMGSNTFGLVGSVPTMIEPGGVGRFNVGFSPSAASVGEVGTLVVEALGPHTVALRGAAVASLAAAPVADCEGIRPCTTFDVGSTPRDFAIAVFDDGVQPFAITGVQLEGTTDAFSSTFVPPVQVSSGWSADCSSPDGAPVPGLIPLRFATTMPGMHRARLTATLSTGSTLQVELVGTIAASGLDVTPAFLHFDPPMGSGMVTITNRDQAAIAVNALCLDLDGDGACGAIDVACGTMPGSDATLGLTCQSDRAPGMLAPSEIITVAFTWMPGAMSFATRFLVESMATHSVALTGGARGSLSGLPAAISVATWPMGATASGRKSFTLTNDGMAPVVISRIAFEGMDPDDFAIARTVPFTLAPMETTTLELRFTNNDATLGTERVTLAITHDGTGASPAVSDVRACAMGGDAMGLLPPCSQPSCASHAECPLGFACRARVCTSSCTSSQPLSGGCVVGAMCSNAVCLTNAACSETQDCAYDKGLVCDFSTGRCVEAATRCTEGETETVCDSGFLCHVSVCHQSCSGSVGCPSGRTCVNHACE